VPEVRARSGGRLLGDSPFCSVSSMLALMHGLGTAGLYLRSTVDPAPDAQFSNQ
jgi:hypothetical protein